MKKVHIERLLLVSVILFVVAVLSSLLIIIESTVLIFCGVSNKPRGINLYIIGVTIWGILGIPIVVAASFLWAKMAKHSNRLYDMLLILFKATTAYTILSFSMCIISTCVVLIWNGPKPEEPPSSMMDNDSHKYFGALFSYYSRVDRDSDLRSQTYFFASLVQIGYILVTAGCHNFNFPHRFFIETAVFYVATFCLAVTIASTMSKTSGRTLLLASFAFELTTALTHQLFMIFELYPNSFYTPNSEAKSSTKKAKGKNPKRIRKMIF